jgi:hypothetical protein
MSQTATPEPTAAEVLPAHESDNLWTADSERQPAELQTSDPVPANEPVEVEPTPEPIAAAPERDESGQFKPRGKKRDDPIARMKDATAKEAAAKEDARLAREEAAALRARIEALEGRDPTTGEQAAAQRARNAQPQPQNGRFPSFDAWSAANPDKDYDDYTDARADYRYAVLESQRQQQQVVQTYHQQLEVAKQNDPVLVQALANDPPVSPLMERAILSSPKSIDIVRYLGTHPEDCAQLARESATTSFDAVPVMRRHLESIATLSAARPDSAPSVKPSTANPPINRVGGTASATPVDPDDLPFGPDYIRAENAREKKRQESSRW